MLHDMVKVERSLRELCFADYDEKTFETYITFDL